AVREAPPGLMRSDRIRVETEPMVRSVELRAESARGDILEKVHGLASHLQSRREGFQGKDEAARLAVLLKDERIQGALLQPLAAALAHTDLRADESARVTAAAHESLVWMTDNDIVGAKATLQAG